MSITSLHLWPQRKKNHKHKSHRSRVVSEWIHCDWFDWNICDMFVSVPPLFLRAPSSSQWWGTNLSSSTKPTSTQRGPTPWAGPWACSASSWFLCGSSSKWRTWKGQWCRYAGVQPQPAVIFLVNSFFNWSIIAFKRLLICPHFKDIQSPVMEQKETRLWFYLRSWGLHFFWKIILKKLWSSNISDLLGRTSDTPSGSCVTSSWSITSVINYGIIHKDTLTFYGYNSFLS